MSDENVVDLPIPFQRLLGELARQYFASLPKPLTADEERVQKEAALFDTIIINLAHQGVNPDQAVQVALNIVRARRALLAEKPENVSGV